MGSTLAERLAHNKHDVVAIDTDKSVCEDLTARTGIVAVHGSATDVDCLEQAGITRADVAVAAMRDDGDNLAFSLLSRRFDVPRIFARIRKNQSKPAFDLVQGTKTLSITDVFLNQLVFEIERPNLQHVATFGNGKANIVIAKVTAGSIAEGKSVAELTRIKGFPGDCVIAGIYREETGEFIFPRGSQRFQAEDHVFLAAGVDAIRAAAGFFTV